MKRHRCKVEYFFTSSSVSRLGRSEEEDMRGVGGPLLCIGDLLSDVVEEDAAGADRVPVEACQFDPDFAPDAADLPRLFQEHYNRLNKALESSDQAWTDLTLKLCSAVETANKVIECTNANVSSLSEKVGELETIMKRADSTIAVARAVNNSLNQKESS